MLGRRPLGHGRIGDQHRVVPADNYIEPEWSRAGFVVDHQPHLAQRLAERAGGAGDHRVGLAQREHRRREIIAILVHQPLHFAS